jgi:hypothetical protein
MELILFTQSAESPYRHVVGSRILFQKYWGKRKKKVRNLNQVKRKAMMHKSLKRSEEKWQEVFEE